ncbi:hypothetical protein C8A01DRAFT_50975 [Parachaetomium inaequale]|uniref:Uncharacterized protein n=1 Tax=Parachaetomium inaequale TaxID=2588326 RepID=A0AAN6SLL8_9PEZI|nr:hypothetical protein C8A01DRAFT_50975 [Parachaetomium inaequale]
MNDTASNLSVLDTARAGTFKQALARALSTPVAEVTFSEILDGLPTEPSVLDFHLRNEGNPGFALNHTTLCPSMVERFRDLKDRFDPLTLTFPPGVLSAFQQRHPGTKPFELRLIELLAVACHQIAVHLYNPDDGAHKHCIYEEWRHLSRGQIQPGQYIAPTPFYHRSYLAHEQYPNGVADIVGYWAEAKIFGGVVIFDRGESGTDCRALFLHPARFKGPRTIFPPTPKQYDALVNFLLGPAPGPSDVACPIPIHATLENRWRYDPWDSMTRFNIFRDRYERKAPNGPRPRRCVKSAIDWPELRDENLVLALQDEAREGKPLGQAAMDAALERLKQITPSSPLWGDWGGLAST